MGQNSQKLGKQTFEIYISQWSPYNFVYVQLNVKSSLPNVSHCLPGHNGAGTKSRAAIAGGGDFVQWVHKSCL